MQQAAEIRVGIFVVIAVGLGVFIASNLKGGIAGRARGYEFEIWFQAAPGVGKGSPVRLSGVEIGEVLDKDVLSVTETVEVQPNPDGGVLPFVQVTTWSHGESGTGGEVKVTVRQRRLTAEQAAKLPAMTPRQRSVARLFVRVEKRYDLYTRFSYGITGGVVFGDKQLEISDLGPDGFPLSAEARGESIRALREQGKRVAVLGAAPPNLDQIVSNVEQVVDEETTARAKQIVANIERATDEAAELVSALRSTISANQGNVDRMMLNAADTSEEIRAAVAEARVLAQQSLANIERMSAVGQRVAEGNEARMNRIVANVETTTGSLARVAKNNETKVDQTMTDIAATVREVREMIASNRAHIDHIAEKLSETADNIQGLTGDSRQQIAGILEKVDESVGSVRRLLQETDEQLKAVAENAAAITADARATMATVNENIGPITTNLRETSANINTASRNVAELSADPATKQILNNVERTTAEARELIADLRSITADPQLQSDVRATAHSMRSASEGLNNTFGRLRTFKPYASAEVYYVPDESRWQSDLNLDIATGARGSIHLGADNITRDPVLNAQLGRSIFLPYLRLRYGFYRSQLAVGADYDFWPGGRLRTQLYNFEDPHLNAKFIYDTPFGFTGLFGIEDFTDGFNWTFGVQFGKDLP